MSKAQAEAQARNRCDDPSCCGIKCKQCGSTNTYISPNGYDTVLVCRDCHSEEHKPYAQA